MLPGKGQIQTFLASGPLMHEQVKCFLKEEDKGHFDTEQKKTEECHILRCWQREPEGIPVEWF